MKSLKYIFVTLVQLIAVAAHAQSGASAANGIYLNYNDYVNSPRTMGGDVDVDAAGYMEIGVNGVMEIYGAVNNKGTIEVDSNGVLTVFGDMVNNGTIILHKGAIIRFYGKQWKNTPSAKVIDGAAPNTVPGGDLNFVGGRPFLPGDWTVASTYLSAYGGDNARQYNDGGNVALDAVVRLQNSKGVELVNTPTRIEGKLQWDVRNGNVILGNNDLTFTLNATQDGFKEDRYAITSGNGHVVKENFIGEWIFPVGKDTNDYTPAAIDNVTPNTMHISVQDYATSGSVEHTEYTVQDGMERTWNIYADLATGTSTITLQHNPATNQPVYVSTSNYITRWSNTDPNNTGDLTGITAWQKNAARPSATGNLSSTGTIEGTEMNNRTYRNFATSASDAIAYYTKASDAFRAKPPVTNVMLFDADSLGCEATVSFTSGKEINISKFQLQHSVDGKTFTTITTFDPKGDKSVYNFKHITPVEGINYYRIAMVQPSGDYTLSDVVTTIVDCSKKDPVTVLYPNPATESINIAGLVGNSEIHIMNLHGRVMTSIKTTNAVEHINISGLPAATYVAQILTGTQNKITSIKFVKF